MNINELLLKPVWQMTGEEFLHLHRHASQGEEVKLQPNSEQPNMRNIGESKIYLIPQLVANNEYWINPRLGDYDLQTHYDNIKQMVKAKTGRAMQEKERERKTKGGKIVKVAGCSPIREGVLLIKPDTTLEDVHRFGEECQQLGYHTAANIPSLRRGALARWRASSRRQGEFSDWWQMV